MKILLIASITLVTIGLIIDLFIAWLHEFWKKEKEWWEEL